MRPLSAPHAALWLASLIPAAQVALLVLTLAGCASHRRYAEADQHIARLVQAEFAGRVVGSAAWSAESAAESAAASAAYVAMSDKLIALIEAAPIAVEQPS